MQTESRHILGMRVDGTSYREASDQIAAWAQSGQPAYVCVANVHMTMESYDDPDFRAIVNGASLVTPDGVPLVWVLRALGIKDQQRVYGPELMLHVVSSAAERGTPIALYGGTDESLNDLSRRLEKRFPALRITAKVAPPFRPLTEEEEAAYARTIAASGARIVFVGIGCPKQERWMSRQVENMSAVLIGVGAAFDFHSGRVRQAPGWMQRAGLEWLFRLIAEPRRLWKRYAKHNPRFAFLIARQLLRRPGARGGTA